MAKKKKNKRITQRERKFIQALPVSATLGEAAVAAGYSDKNPRQSGFQAMEGLRAKFSDLLDRHGLTDDALIDKYLLPLLSAKTTKHFAHHGKIVSTRSYSDNTTRFNALDATFRLKGAYSPKTEEEARINQQFTGPTVIVLDLPRPKRPTQGTINGD